MTHVFLSFHFLQCANRSTFMGTLPHIRPLRWGPKLRYTLQRVFKFSKDTSSLTSSDFPSWNFRQIWDNYFWCRSCLATSSPTPGRWYASILPGSAQSLPPPCCPSASLGAEANSPSPVSKYPSPVQSALRWLPCSLIVWLLDSIQDFFSPLLDHRVRLLKSFSLGA